VYGLEAIEANNGWAMAATGVIIVMTGLAVLSFIISQLHKIIMFFEHGAGLLSFNNGKQKRGGANGTTGDNEKPADLDHELSCIGNLLLFYRTVTEQLGDEFDLKDLYMVFRENDFPHPHLTIRTLRDDGYLVPTRDHKFTWNL